MPVQSCPTWCLNLINDPKSALRRSSVRVVTRECRGGGEEIRVKEGRKQRRRDKETAEWRKTDDQMSWKRKKNKCAFLCLMFYFFPGPSPSGGQSWEGGGVRMVQGRSKVIVVFLCVGQLSAAVRRRLPLSMHGGALVFHAVQVLLLRDGQNRGQDLIVLPVRQTWNTHAHRPGKRQHIAGPQKNEKSWQQAKSQRSRV